MQLRCEKKKYNNQTEKTTNQSTLSLFLKRQYKRLGKVNDITSQVSGTHVTVEFSWEMLNSVEEV